MSNTPNKEQVYDEQIHPLIGQILTICQAHGIACIASFAIPTEEEPDLVCTSMLTDENDESGPGHQRALSALKGGNAMLALTITKPTTQQGGAA